MLKNSTRFSIDAYQLEWDGKTLASMSKMGSRIVGIQYHRPTHGFIQTGRGYSLKNEVVNAIIRRTVDDTLGNRYHFAR